MAASLGFEKFFTGLTPLSDPCIQALRDHWTVEIELNRKEYLYQPGKIGNHLYYVVEGELWIYYLIEGREVCVGLSYPDTLTSSAASFISDFISANSERRLPSRNIRSR